jgi:hypothetical protein
MRGSIKGGGGGGRVGAAAGTERSNLQYCTVVLRGPTVVHCNSSHE